MYDLVAELSSASPIYEIGELSMIFRAILSFNVIKVILTDYACTEFSSASPTYEVGGLFRWLSY